MAAELRRRTGENPFREEQWGQMIDFDERSCACIVLLLWTLGEGSNA